VFYKNSISFDLNFKIFNMKKKYNLFASGLIALAVNSVYAQCPVPSLVSATPSTLCVGATTSLNATAVGSSINWYTVPAGGVSLGSSLSGVNFSISPSTTTTYYAESYVVASGVNTFNYTGSLQSYTVPAGVTTLTIDARGAQGGGSNGGGGGLGAKMVGTYTVTPGQVLSICVPSMGLLQVGGDAQNSSGGGGGAFVYSGSTLLVAAGGGGGKCNYTGSTALHAGAAGTVSINGNPSSDGAALGGVSGNGGAAGLFSSNPCSGGGTGWLSVGGGPYGGLGLATWAGGVGFCGGGGGGCGGVGGFGGGGGGGNHYGGGGGGGGYSGGGGGTDPTHGGGGGSFSSGTAQSNVSGFQSGNGQIIITGSSSSCVSVSRTAVTVVVGAIPTISATSGAICSGSSYTIVPSGASSYTYSSGSAIVTPTANTSYSVTGTSSLGCVGSNTAVSSVTVNANPTVTSSTSNSLICVGETVVLTASTSATSYTWNTGVTTMSVSVSPSVTTTYTVNVSNAAACVASSTIMVTVNACTGINEVVANSISVYPNPNNGILNILLTSELSKNSIVEIYDGIGKLVVKQILTNEVNTINISNLNNGIYTFKVLNNSNLVKIGKIVKQ
jgi:hypothetical protein